MINAMVSGFTDTGDIDMRHNGQSSIRHLESRVTRTRSKGPAGKAFYDLGLACAMGSDDTPIDLVQAHKWFNLAAMAGLKAAQEDRAEIASNMSAAQIATAQREARAFLAATTARAA